MSDETYNGWKNYPTWCVNLWLSNDEGLYSGTLIRVADTVKNPPHTSEFWNEEQTTRYNVADMLKEWVSDMGISVVNRYAGDSATGDPQGFAADLFSYALGEVDWHEIADAWIAAASEQVS